MQTDLESKTDRSIAGSNKTILGKRDGNVLITVKIQSDAVWPGDTEVSQCIKEWLVEQGVDDKLGKNIWDI